MPTSKRKRKVQENGDSAQHQQQLQQRAAPGNTEQLKGTETLPLYQYTSAVGVHTTLLGFTALFLPRTAFLSALIKPEWDPARQSSRDKPQHPFLDALTSSPVSTLTWICLGVALLQGWWAGWMRRWYIDTLTQGSLEEKNLQKVMLEKQKFKNFRDACIATVVMSFVFHILLILFGAPVTDCSTPFATGAECPSDGLILRTYLMALLLSLLITPTPTFTLGVPKFGNDSQSLVHRLTWTRLYAEISLRNSIERALVYPVLGALAGSWLGAIPIALDWDRPWQAWPLTPAFGAIAGFMIGSLSALTATAVGYVANEHLRSQVSISKSN
ncbi:hypothetical protein AX17_007023 [Amanita inopinata Kibby_2008]|nr:hypothetical protein AX17_007023 [Amanita inopinata Kibby_2008]